MLQINKYLEVFPREAFLFLFMDELNSDPRSVLAKLCRFLDVHDNVDLLAQQEVFANTATSFQRDRLRSHITEPLRKVAVIHKCAMMLPQGCRDYAYHLLRSSPYGKRIQRAHSPPLMRPETRRRLLAHFQQPNRELAEFLGVELANWNR
jgi:hypothetical protein